MGNRRDWVSFGQCGRRFRGEYAVVVSSFILVYSLVVDLDS